MANCLHVTRFIMLAPIARNTLRSFHGVIHRGVITNAYCGSAETRASGRARGPQISCCARDIVRRYLSSSLLSPPPPPLSRFQFCPRLFSSRTANNYNGRSACVVTGGTLMRSFHRTLAKVQAWVKMTQVTKNKWANISPFVPIKKKNVNV